MPIEIRELIIKAEIGSSSKDEGLANRLKQNPKISEEEVQEIVSRVVDVLRKREER